MASGRLALLLCLLFPALGWPQPSGPARPRGAEPTADDVAAAFQISLLPDARVRALLFENSICRAITARDFAPCSSIANLEPNMEKLCRWRMVHGLFLLEGPSSVAMGACVNMLSSDKEMTGGGESGNCRKLAGLIQSRADVCGGNWSGKTAKTVEACRQEFAFLNGPNACSRVKQPFGAAVCSDLGRLSEALRSRNAAACGASAFCQALASPSAAGCAAVGKQAVSAFLASGSLDASAQRIRTELQVRAKYGFPMNDVGGRTMVSIASRIARENQYRSDNRYPPFKRGDTFLSETLDRGPKDKPRPKP